MYVQPCEHRGLHLLAGKRCLEHWKTLPIVSAATNHVQARRGGAKLSCFHSLWPTGCHINVALLAAPTRVRGHWFCRGDAQPQVPQVTRC